MPFHRVILAIAVSIVAVAAAHADAAAAQDDRRPIRIRQEGSTPLRRSQHLIEPGADWSHLANSLEPGDEILLLPGEHLPIKLIDVAGTATAPIVIRPLRAGERVTIRGGTVGVELRGVAHVQVSGVSIVGAERTAILVRASDRHDLAHIRLRDIVVREVAGLAEEAGIIVRDTAGIRLEDIDIETTRGPALILERAGAVRIDRSTLLVRPTREKRVDQVFCVRDARRGPIVLSATRVIGGTALGVQVEATSDVDGELDRRSVESLARGTELRGMGPTDVIDADRLVHEGLLDPDLVQRGFAESGRVFLLASQIEGSVGGIALGPRARLSAWHTTIQTRDHVIAAVVGEGAPEDLLLESCLVVPSGRAGPVALLDDALEERVALGENLWWFGMPSTPQTSVAIAGSMRFPQLADVDPDLDDDLAPRSDTARAFGRHSHALGATCPPRPTPPSNWSDGAATTPAASAVLVSEPDAGGGDD